VKDGPGWAATALAVACALLLGALVAFVIGPRDDDGAGDRALAAETVTVSRTVTVGLTSTTQGTTIVRTLVPQVVGQRLDIAKRQLQARRFEVDVDGGGLFGVVRERNWRVTEQAPAAGTYLEQGSSVRITVKK
jgi:hypothetical protein